MKGYLIANVSVEDAVAYEGYRSRTQAIIEQYGGRFLVRGGEVDVREGNPCISRLIVLEFPSVEAAHTFYDSPEYRVILPIRTDNATSTLFIVSGV